MRLNDQDRKFIEELKKVNGGDIFKYITVEDGRIVELIIDDKRVKNIPKSILNLDELIKLEFRWTNLKLLPKFLTDLTNLKIFYLNNPGITSLPVFLDNLDLKILRVQSMLREFPKWLKTSKIPNFSLIFASDVKIPEDLDNIEISHKEDYIHLFRTESKSSRKIAGLDSEKVSQVDIKSHSKKEFVNVSELNYPLKKLILNDKYLKEIPEEVFEYTELKELQLNSNKISHIPEEITNLKELRVLELGSNRINKIPEYLKELTKLRKLKLSYNFISEIPNIIINLQKLKHLDLTSNELAEIPQVLTKLPELEELILDGNKQISKLTSVINDFPSLKSLDLSFIGDFVVEEKIEKITNITHLYLNTCKIEELVGPIENFVNLELLDLNHNCLDNFPIGICEIEGLRILDLERNYMQELPEEIGQLSNLVEFNCSANFLKELPNSFTKLQKLRRVILHSNNFKSFPKELKELRDLRYINLNENMQEVADYDLETEQWVQQFLNKGGRLNIGGLW